MLAATAVLAGCIVSPLDPSLSAAVFTSEAEDTYGIVRSGTAIVASAPASNTGFNTRVVFWPKSAPVTIDQESCATWTSTTDSLHQQGAVLRRHSINGVNRAITVTKNVYGGANWIINVHVWDSSIGGGLPAVQIASFDLGSVLVRGGNLAALPWRMCARAVDDVVSFIVWPTSDPQPDWADQRYVRAVRLPPGWTRAGVPGGYVGHLVPGGSMRYTSTTVHGLDSTDLAARRPAAMVPVAEPTAIPGLP